MDDPAAADVLDEEPQASDGQVSQPASLPGGGLDFEAWRSWSGADVAIFISHFCGLPEYAPSVQHNLTGPKLQHLASQGMLGKGLARAGINNFEHQRLISSAVAQLGAQSPRELYEMMQEKLEAQSGTRPTWFHHCAPTQPPGDPPKRTPRPGQRFTVPVLPRLPDPLPPADVRHDPEREEELSRRSRNAPRPYSEDPADGTESLLSEDALKVLRKFRAKVASSMEEYESMIYVEPAVVGVRGLQQLQARKEEEEDESAREELKRLKREEAAAIQIQAAERGKAARKSVSAMKTLEKERCRQQTPEADRHSSLQPLQSDSDEAQIRQMQLEMRQHAAAAHLQARYRGNSIREQFRQRKQEDQEGELQVQEAIPEAMPPQPESTADEEAAAVKIQALHRGNHARRTVEAMIVEQEQAMPPQPESTSDEEAAAVKIQALHRGNHARRTVEAMIVEQEQAMIVEQEQARLREDEQAAKEVQAATRIQALYRGAAARSDVEAMLQDSTGGPLYEDSLEEASGSVA